MAIKYNINSNLPSLYRYMILCILEKRGDHSISDVQQNPRLSNINDIEYLLKYIDLSFKIVDYNDEIIEFLNEIKNTIRNTPFEVHLTRDYQVIETGNHYVSLSFKIKTKDYINNISFKSRFKQKIQDYPEGNNKIMVSYSRDYLENFQGCKYIYSFNKKNYYRYTLFSYDFEIKNDNGMFSADYLIPDNYVCQADLSVESCIVV
tara:strand:+ start:358 stop:972 length:615 start_codon:yes stop_codon:yes gene_type:complete